MRKLLVCSSVLLFNLAIMSQSSQPIIIGTFGVGNPDSAFYFKTNLENSFGFNTKFTNFLFPNPDTWYTYTGPVIPFSGSQNFSSLTTINNIGGILGTSSHYLANGKRNTDNYVRNFDWLYYFTGGLYSVWPGYDNSNSVYKTMLKHITGNSTDSSGYWSSGSVPGIMAYGPTWGGDNSPQPGSRNCGYKQETRYRASGSYFTPDSTEYEAKFNIFPYTVIDTTGNPVVCSLLVLIHYQLANSANKDTTDTIKMAIRALEVLDEDNLKVVYNLGKYQRNINLYDEHPYIYQKTEFQVHWVGGRKILLRDIEVYDVNIYKNVFMNLDRINEVKDSIYNYLSRIKSHSSPFYNNNFKYHQSVDEPHTRDLFPALRYVNRVLDTLRSGSLGTAPKLFTHFYPEWNGYWDFEHSLSLYYDSVLPDPFVYYYHYSVGDDEQVTMFYNWSIHQQASVACGNKPFHFIIDVWDQQNVSGGQAWRAPSKSEMTASIMGALSFGCKGIYYEPFFSYGTVKGLVELDNNLRQYVPNELGYFVKDSLNIRLSGPLGITLNKLKFTDSSATIRFFYTKPKDTENIPLSESGSAIIDYLKIENNLSGGEYFFHAGLLEDSIDNSSKYFMLCNLYTDTLQQQRKVKITIASATNFVNHTLSDIESVYPDTTINRSNNFIFTRTMKPGDATLYRIVPVVQFGGNLFYNETINAGCNLKEKALRVKAGVTLTINANYTCSQDIIVEPGGKLVINPGKSLTFTNGAKLRVYGSFISRGTSNSPIGINFTAVDIAKQNGIYLDSLSIDSLEYTNVSNCYFGIHSRYTDPYISECNISNTKVGIYLDNAEYQPDMEEG
ncbi:MAG: hypothetical protein HUU54_15705, partial [Ignavibacteriaceae bacterium]|nr:hypothetical protein [Ignavibacteriaceae bacterium]